MSRFLQGMPIFREVTKYVNNSKRCYIPLSSFSTFNEKESYVVMTDDSKTIVCWHPEKAPAYEHTKPLPEFVPELNEGDSVLKVQYRRDEKYRFKTGGPTIPELAKMTYTTKHRWYPNNKDKYLDPNPPVDRDGI